jgi:hypothetical protein
MIFFCIFTCVLPFVCFEYWWFDSNIVVLEGEGRVFHEMCVEFGFGNDW